MTYPKSGLAATVLCLAVLLALPATLPAQITFERTYGGPNSDAGGSALQTADGGYLVVGTTWSYGAGGADLYLIKTDSRGDTMWTRTFGGDTNDNGCMVRQTSDGGYIIAGYTLSFGSGYEDVYLVKTDSLGDSLWTRTYGGASADVGGSVWQTTDGGYVVGGYTYSYGNGGRDVYLIKTDVVGDTQWTRAFGGPSNDGGSSVQQTYDSGYIIAGATASFGRGSYDVYLIRTDSHGDTLWTRTFGDSWSDGGWSVQQTADSGFVVAGHGFTRPVQSTQFYVVKTNPSGDTLWTRFYGGFGYDRGYSVRQTEDGGYIVAGYSECYDPHMNDKCALLRTDSRGNARWFRNFGGPSNDHANSVQQTVDGGYIVAGYTYSFGAGNADIYLIKADSLGYVYVGVEEPETPPTRASALSLSCSPNPASGSVTISLSPSIPSSLSSVLRLFDASGRLVLSLPVSTSSFVLRTSDLPSGVYLVRLDCGALHASTRLVIQK